jgi:hypothetical protein
MCESQAHISILVEFVRGDIIHGENELHIIFPSLFYERFDVFRTSLVKQGISDLRTSS